MNRTQFALAALSLTAAAGLNLGVSAGAAADASSAGENSVEISVQGDFRVIVSNGLPDHKAGQFPNRNNPNTIRPQKYTYRVPLHPRANERATPTRMQPFGVAVNGVPFDPGTAEFWRDNPRSGWIYEAMSGKINLGLDANHAHVQPGGAYHYHALPTGLIERLGGQKRRMLLLGYAADGFPIYGTYCYSDPNDAASDLKPMRSSFRLKQGKRPASGPPGTYDGTFIQDWEYVAGAGDLDECNGRSGVTPAYPNGTYYYVLTETFPYIPRAFRGTPDASFDRHGPPPGGRGGPGPGGRRPPPFGPPPGPPQ